VVEDLAIKYHHDIPIWADQRLVARIKIKDAQPGGPKRDYVRRKMPLMVRPAMHQRPQSAVQYPARETR
jgi:hypothetical protein